MITQITIYLPNDTSISYVVGKEDVEQIFQDREKEGVIVVVLKDRIEEYASMRYQASRARKAV